MLKTQVSKIIEECQEFAKKGLHNGHTADIPSLVIDFLAPPKNLIGNLNPALFINANTFKLLHRKHKNWISNQTIAVQQDFLKNKRLTIIGVIVHEVGHAFNVAANIANSEENANIFEIEMLRHLFLTKNPLLQGYLKKDLYDYFDTRLQNYALNKSPSNKSLYLQYLIAVIKNKQIFSSALIFPCTAILPKKVGFFNVGTLAISKIAKIHSEQHIINYDFNENNERCALMLKN